MQTSKNKKLFLFGITFLKSMDISLKHKHLTKEQLLQFTCCKMPVFCNAILLQFLQYTNCVIAVMHYAYGCLQAFGFCNYVRSSCFCNFCNPPYIYKGVANMLQNSGAIMTQREKLEERRANLLKQQSTMTRKEYLDEWGNLLHAESALLKQEGTHNDRHSTT